MSKIFKDQRGIAHAAIVIGVVIFVAVAGIIVWRVSDAQQFNPFGIFGNQSDCALEDNNICKFLSSWTEGSDYRITSTQTADGQSSSILYEISNNGTRYHAKVDVEGSMTYEVIGIDTAIYTKSMTEDKWWKQNTDNNEDATGQYDALGDFTDNVVQTEDGSGNTNIEYKKLGTEKCGDLTCYKYQVVDPDNTDTTQFVWFDKKDYKVRKIVSEAPSSTSTQEFSYDNISIEVPANVEELAPGEMINPLTGEKITIPTELEIDMPTDLEAEL